MTAQSSFYNIYIFTGPELIHFFTKILAFVHLSNPGAKIKAWTLFCEVFFPEAVKSGCCSPYGIRNETKQNTNLRINLLNFLATDVYALLLRSKPGDIRPIQSWAKIWVLVLISDETVILSQPIKLKLDNSKLGSTQQQKIWWHWHVARIISSQKIYVFYTRKHHIVEMRGDDMAFKATHNKDESLPQFMK